MRDAAPVSCYRHRHATAQCTKHGRTHNLPQVAERPPAFVVDTPGVMPVKLLDDEMALKLALIGAP